MIDFCKAWARIDDERFDAILPALIDAATDLAEHETGQEFSEPPPPVKAWIAAHVAYWIDNPAAATERQMLPSPFLAGLLDPFRTFSWLESDA